MNKNFIAGLNESGYKGIVTHYIFDYQEFWYIDKIKKFSFCQENYCCEKKSDALTRVAAPKYT